MSYYVRIRKLNGRQDHANLASWVLDSGIKEVEYCEGGWQDQCINLIAPHLKFENETDALAYILANGGEYSTHLPSMNAKEMIGD